MVIDKDLIKIGWILDVNPQFWMEIIAEQRGLHRRPSLN